MAGLPWLMAVQDELYEQYGEDLVTVDPSTTTELTFANGQKTRSIGRITVPAFIGDESGTLTFTGIDHNGPALLGMDHLRALGFCVDFNTGRCAVKNLAKDFQLPRLNNGHLFLDILNIPSDGAGESAQHQRALPSS